MAEILYLTEPTKKDLRAKHLFNAKVLVGSRESVSLNHELCLAPTRHEWSKKIEESMDATSQIRYRDLR